MRIEIYVDDATEPLQVLRPPQRFALDTESLSDGQHVLRLRAIDKGDAVSERVVPFLVQNGPAIAVHGIAAGDAVSGEVSILANAYSSRIGDEFEPVRIETPAPIPTWAWLLVLAVLAWGAGYLSQELHDRVDVPYAARSPAPDSTGTAQSSSAAPASSTANAVWAARGERVYGNNCSSCHQGNGAGLAGVFPPLKGNPAVLDADPTDHINAILHGLAGKAIDGVNYPTPMPPFGAILDDADIAAVVNHERTQWGNDAPLVSADGVAALR